MRSRVPLEVPVLPEVQYRLPLQVGHTFDFTILAGNALRPIADQWCRAADLEGMINPYLRVELLCQLH